MNPSPSNPSSNTPPSQSDDQPDRLPHEQRRARRPKTAERLRRSRDNRVLAGLLGGIAEFVDADPRLLRVLAVVVTVLSLGIFVIGYLILWVLVPLEPAPDADERATTTS